MDFWLGTHEPHWLAKLDVPLFVSHRRFTRRPMRLPRALAPWALDSGGFTQLRDFGRWTLTAPEYAEAVHVYAEQIGHLAWAASQDWMCEPQIIRGGTLPDGTAAVGTGLSVAEHQERTVANYLELRELGPWFVPVLQGYGRDEYHACADLYAEAGVDLTAEPLVGLGSVCRREATGEIGRLVAELQARGLRLHGFGVKKAGLVQYGHLLASADSMAWSAAGRKNGPLPECSHASCANCKRYALRWRDQLLAGRDAAQLERDRQPALFA